MDNFVVSARKYRPSTFVSVVGQAHITSTLRNAIDRNQLAHAYLFCGPRGVGKTTCARIFAKNINCQSPKDGEACEECESCRSFNEGRSFSIHELDAASNNSVDDIRNLTDQVRIPPQTGRYSVYIIDEVHMLSQSAFNAFLKTLEEPPAHAIFILATTEKHKILPTILSRCQGYDFNRIRVEDTVGYLKHIAQNEGVSYDDESLNIIARKADGGMRDALSMFDKVVSFCDSKLVATDVASTLNMLDYDTYFKITDIILSGNYQAALIEFDRVLNNGFSGSTFISGLGAHMRDLLMCKDPNTMPLLEVTGSVAQRYKSQAEQTPVPLLFEGISLLSSLDTGYKTSSNQRLYFELGLMKLCGLGQKKNEPTLTLELPPLSKEAAPVVAPQIEIEAPKVKVETPKVAAPKIEIATPKAVEAETPAPKIVETTPKATVSETPAPKATVERPKRNGPSISGTSLSQIINGQAEEQQPETEANNTTIDNTPAPVEQNIEKLLERGCYMFVGENEAPRPRVAMAFKTAEISENRIVVRVASPTLNEEISNSRFDILSRIAELGGIKCAIEIEVIVDESVAKVKPIKVEDRIKHLLGKNPDLLLLKQQLDMDVE